MRKNIYAILGFSFISIVACAQKKIQFKDFLSKQAVENVILFSDKNTVVGVSNEVGIIELIVNDTVNKFYSSHLAYDTEEIELENTKTDSIIIQLIPKIKILPVIEVFSTNSLKSYIHKVSLAQAKKCKQKGFNSANYTEIIKENNKTISSCNVSLAINATEINCYNTDLIITYDSIVLSLYNEFVRFNEFSKINTLKSLLINNHIANKQFVFNSSKQKEFTVQFNKDTCFYANKYAKGFIFYNELAKNLVYTFYYNPSVVKHLLPNKNEYFYFGPKMLSIKSFYDKDEISFSQTLIIEKINGEFNAYEAIGEFIVFKNAKRDRGREKLNLSISIKQQIK
jgi:hypothetical protein